MIVALSNYYGSMDELSAADHLAFQGHMVALTRAFGWHRPGTTPCGRAVPIAEAHALLELSKSRSLTQQELASVLNLRKSTVSRLVANLQSRGWITRQRNEDDGRALDVSLTRQGAEAAADLAVARGAKMASVLSRVPKSERDAVVTALKTLVEAIHESET